MGKAIETCVLCHVVKGMVLSGQVEHQSRSTRLESLNWGILTGPK